MHVAPEGSTSWPQSYIFYRGRNLQPLRRHENAGSRCCSRWIFFRVLNVSLEIRSAPRMYTSDFDYFDSVPDIRDHRPHVHLMSGAWLSSISSSSFSGEAAATHNSPGHGIYCRSIKLNRKSSNELRLCRSMNQRSSYLSCRTPTQNTLVSIA